MIFWHLFRINQNQLSHNLRVSDFLIKGLLILKVKCYISTKSYFGRNNANAYERCCYLSPTPILPWLQWRLTLPPRGHLALCGDNFGCHNWAMFLHLLNRGQGCAKSPTMLTQLSATKNYPAPTSTVPRWMNPVI